MENPSKYFNIREAAAFGIEMISKLQNLKVLISGLRGVGVETAKNLIITGPNSVVIHDDSIVTLRDLGSNIYLNENDIGVNSRAEASLNSLKELNSQVDVQVHKGDLNNDLLLQFDVVFLTDSDLETLQRINHFCRNNGHKRIGFISCESWGAAGYAFVDFGADFKCFDKDGQKLKSYVVSDIIKANPGVVRVHEDRTHSFTEGDWVVFKEVQGMVEINHSAPMPVKFLSPYRFSVGDTSNFSEYTREGIVMQVKVPTTFNFHSFQDSLVNPFINEELMNTDYSKFDRYKQLHLAVWAVREFQSKHKTLPELHNQDHASEIIELAHQINNNQKVGGFFCVETVDENVIKLVSLYARAQPCPFASFWGGIIAQEIVKFLGKFTPIQQWLYIDFFEIIPDSVDRTLRNSRYDDQISLVGNEVHDRLAMSKSLLVGSGGLGNEILKLYSMMGLSTKGGEVIVVDGSQVKNSDLGHAFLFKRNDLNLYKSEKAIIAARKINNETNFTSKQEAMNNENQETFNDEFWKSLSFVTTATKSTKTQFLINDRCVWYEKSFLVPRTLGTNADLLIVLPHKTQTFSDSPGKQEENIMFYPRSYISHTSDHCIEWAKIEFEKAFFDIPIEVNKYLQNPEAYLALPGISEFQETSRSKLKKIKKFLLLLKEPNFEECVRIARQLFEKFFYNRPSRQLNVLPPNHVTNLGLPFWSGPRRMPTPVVFDVNDQTHLEFIFAASNLMASVLGIPNNRNLLQIKEMVGCVKVKSFNPTFSDKKNHDNPQNNYDQKLWLELVEQIKIVDSKIANLRVIPIIFDIDDDSNFNIDFITRAANIRSRVYKIPETSKIDAKIIAGKISPSVGFSNAMIAAAAAIELYKLHQDATVDNFRNLYASLGTGFFNFSEPLPPVQTKSKDYDPITLGPVKAYPEGFSVWDKLTIEGPCTLQEFIDIIARDHKLKTNLVLCEKIVLYNGYLRNSNLPERLTKFIHSLYEELSGKILGGKRDLSIAIGCEGDEDDCEYLVPLVRYRF